MLLLPSGRQIHQTHAHHKVVWLNVELQSLTLHVSDTVSSVVQNIIGRNQLKCVCCFRSSDTYAQTHRNRWMRTALRKEVCENHQTL